MRRTNRGFTLIEIMIVIAIIGIVITIAAPSYTEYLKKGRRAEVVSLLSEQAQILERFYTRNNVYTGVTGLSAGNDFYTLTPTITDQTFVLTATRKSGTSMATDKCGDFTLTNTGVRGMNNATTGLTTKDCWGR
ncbi:prepilin-type N-terminal cleavage/methylation domain-containing protein [Pseudomonas granadensis]|uniref:Prepilin-type N-terminal cleavage/methylation domain-containing protein n=1 Tax=Pseudomonas granadensis TaxID=1421430 RepID=A0ABX7GE01_9PSED|nr:type IV pilin protein [Pseudomonas granadensis]MBN6775067.1 prepilin-type N-terminal cleavage/methylation domain-containing protein [Pseudomonas granadensis]MBN6806679.1 prepilin-type N-terminal cleavage/methylation domain-containing protein [Pseudomonas granadensis]MBN6832917.1 prepilin-type N-terminal cleavage/methylation domain-containing protein [Pseudomonas granadensis]MBN6840141.1 prepilin-type N-terminal cleavage/methylation domain-containing protein [Pseudomonas granadensis]MBN68695